MSFMLFKQTLFSRKFCICSHFGICYSPFLSLQTEMIAALKLGISISSVKSSFYPPSSSTFSLNAHIYTLISIEDSSKIIIFNNLKREKFLSNAKFKLKLIFLTLLMVDFCYFYHYQMDDPLRIARYVRPGITKIIFPLGLLMLYNKELRRTSKSILLSLQQMI